MPRLSLALIACLLTWAGMAQAEAPSVARAEIVWAGTYEAQIMGAVTQPGTAMGRTNELANTRKLKTTTTVEGRLGVSFGIEYTLVGKPTGAIVPVTIVVILPEPGLHNPSRSERTFREQWLPEPKLIGGTNILGYSFEFPWEVVAGRWTFEIWHDDQKLGEQAFCVVTERPAEGDKGEPCKSVPIT